MITPSATNNEELDLVKATAEGTATGLAKSLHEVIQNLGGPASEELGLELRDTVRDWRLRRAIRIGRRAITIADTRNKPRRLARLKVILPALEHASLEDDPDLQERWAALLATAVDASATEITRAYPEILKELTPLDARVLGRISGRAPDHDLTILHECQKLHSQRRPTIDHARRRRQS